MSRRLRFDSIRFEAPAWKWVAGRGAHFSSELCAMLLNQKSLRERVKADKAYDRRRRELGEAVRTMARLQKMDDGKIANAHNMFVVKFGCVPKTRVRRLEEKAIGGYAESDLGAWRVEINALMAKMASMRAQQESHKKQRELERQVWAMRRRVRKMESRRKKREREERGEPAKPSFTIPRKKKRSGMQVAQASYF